MPQLKYAAPVWQVADCHHLDKIQRKGLAVAASAGMEALEVEAVVLLLDLRREEVAIRELGRILTKNYHEPITTAINSWLAEANQHHERYIPRLEKCEFK